MLITKLNLRKTVAMMRLRSIFILFTLTLITSFKTNGVELSKYAVIYVGPGSCVGCSGATANIARAVGLKVKYVHPGEITKEILSNAAVYIQPGGPDDLIMREAFTQEDVVNIRNYVAHGGRYWGICAGAFFAAENLIEPGHHKVPAIGLIPGTVYDYSKITKARVEQVVWNNKLRWLYFQDGPAFQLTRNELKKVQPFAFYHDGAIAGFTTNFGSGKVLVVGPHAEATADWYAEDQITDPDGLDNDLAIIALSELIK